MSEQPTADIHEENRILINKLNRRSEALQRATYLAAHQQIQAFDAEVVLNMATIFEEYLAGEEDSES